MAHGKRVGASSERLHVRDVVIVGAGPAGLTAARAAGVARATTSSSSKSIPAIGVPVALHRRSRRRGVRRTRSPARRHPRHRRRRPLHRRRRQLRVGRRRARRARRSSIARCSIRRSPTRAAPPAPSCAAARACAPSRSPARRHRHRPTTTAAPIDARACVLACGANYRFNRQLGLGVPRAFVQSAQLEEPFDGPGQVEVHLGREVAPGGFALGGAVPARRRSRYAAARPDVRVARAGALPRVRRADCARASASPARRRGPSRA